MPLHACALSTLLFYSNVDVSNSSFNNLFLYLPVTVSISLFLWLCAYMCVNLLYMCLQVGIRIIMENINHLVYVL